MLAFIEILIKSVHVIERKKLKFCSFKVLEFYLWERQECKFLINGLPPPLWHTCLLCGISWTHHRSLVSSDRSLHHVRGCLWGWGVGRSCHHWCGSTRLGFEGSQGFSGSSNLLVQPVNIKSLYVNNIFKHLIWCNGVNECVFKF